MRPVKRWAIPALVAVGAVAWFSAGEWQSTVGVPCTFDRDFASVLTSTCGAEINVTCTGARRNGTIAHGHTPEAFTDGLTLHAYVSTDDTITLEPCCMAAVSCNPPDAGYSLRVFNP